MSHPMYNPRGAFPGQRPMVSNQFGMNAPPGMDMGGGCLGPQGMTSTGIMSQMMPQQMSFQMPQRNPPLPPDIESSIDLHIRGAREEVRMLNQVLQQQKLDPRLRKESREDVLSPGSGFSGQRLSARTEERTPDWSAYQNPPTKLFATQVVPQQAQATKMFSSLGYGNPAERMQAGGARGPSESHPVPMPAERRQTRYTTESATSILASFGLSNEDLELLSHYPDEQLTPDNLPFILRDIRVRKAKRNFGDLEHSRPSPGAQEHLSSEPRQSKVIDYGHSSKFGYSEGSSETFKREQLTKDTTKSNFASTGAPTSMPSKFAMDAVVSSPSFSSESKRAASCSLPKKLQMDVSKQQHSSNAKTLSSVRDPTSDKQAASNRTTAPHGTRPNLVNLVESSGVAKPGYSAPKPAWVPSFPHGDASAMKRLPTPTMMNDYYAASPRIFPHTCSLCNVECMLIKDWIEHQNNNLHIENCRRLRKQYPEWNPEAFSSLRNESKSTPPRRSPKRRSRSRSRSWSHSLSPWRYRGRSGSRGRGRRSRSRSRSRSSRRYRRSRTRSRSPSPRWIPRRRSRTPPSRRSHSRSPGYLRRSPPRGSRRVSPRRRCRSSSNERLAKKLIQSSGLSVSENTTLEAMMQSLAPAILAELAKKKAGTSSSSKTNTSVSKITKKNEPTEKHGSSASGKSSSSVAKSSSSSMGKSSSSAAAKSSSKAPAKSSSKESDSTNKTVKVKKKSAQPGNYLVRLKNLPIDVKHQEVVDAVKPFGKINNTVLLKALEEATVLMEKEEEAKALTEFAKRSRLLIRGKLVEAILEENDMVIKDPKKTPIIKKKEMAAAKTPTTTQTTKPSPAKNTDTTSKKNKDKKYFQDLGKKGVVQICGLPEIGYVESDLTKLAIPFGFATELIIVPSHRMAFMELPDMQSAEAMVNIYKSIPVKVRDTELTITQLKKPFDLHDPEALFKQVLGLQKPVDVTGLMERLVIVYNMPNGRSAATEVQVLVRKFGSIKQYVALTNKIIFEMKTPNFAKAVFYRFKKFPCIIQNHPLTFSLHPKIIVKEELMKDKQMKAEAKSIKAGNKAPEGTKKAAVSLKAKPAAQGKPQTTPAVTHGTGKPAQPIAVASTPPTPTGSAAVKKAPTDGQTVNTSTPALALTPPSSSAAAAGAAKASEPAVKMETTASSQPETDGKSASPQQSPPIETQLSVQSVDASASETIESSKSLPDTNKNLKVTSDETAANKEVSQILPDARSPTEDASKPPASTQCKEDSVSSADQSKQVACAQQLIDGSEKKDHSSPAGIGHTEVSSESPPVEENLTCSAAGKSDGEIAEGPNSSTVVSLIKEEANKSSDQMPVFTPIQEKTNEETARNLGDSLNKPTSETNRKSPESNDPSVSSNQARKVQIMTVDSLFQPDSSKTVCANDPEASSKSAGSVVSCSQSIELKEPMVSSSSIPVCDKSAIAVNAVSGQPVETQDTSVPVKTVTETSPEPAKVVVPIAPLGKPNADKNSSDTVSKDTSTKMSGPSVTTAASSVAEKVPTERLSLLPSTPAGNPAQVRREGALELLEDVDTKPLDFPPVTEEILRALEAAVHECRMRSSLRRAENSGEQPSQGGEESKTSRGRGGSKAAGRRDELPPDRELRRRGRGLGEEELEVARPSTASRGSCAGGRRGRQASSPSSVSRRSKEHDDRERRSSSSEESKQKSCNSGRSSRSSRSSFKAQEEKMTEKTADSGDISDEMMGMFPFDLDEFVTVDEVGDEADSLSQEQEQKPESEPSVGEEMPPQHHTTPATERPGKRKNTEDTAALPGLRSKQPRTGVTVTGSPAGRLQKKPTLPAQKPQKKTSAVKPKQQKKGAGKAGARKTRAKAAAAAAVAETALELEDENDMGEDIEGKLEESTGSVPEEMEEGQQTESESLMASVHIQEAELGPSVLADEHNSVAEAELTKSLKTEEANLVPELQKASTADESQGISVAPSGGTELKTAPFASAVIEGISKVREQEDSVPDGQATSKDEGAAAESPGLATVASMAAALVTLDEVSEEEEDYPDDDEEDLLCQGLGGVSDPEALVTVDEVGGDEDPFLQAVRDLQALVTLDEIVEEEEEERAGSCRSADTEPFPFGLQDESGDAFPPEHALLTLDETQCDEEVEEDNEKSLDQPEEVPPPPSDTAEPSEQKEEPPCEEEEEEGLEELRRMNFVTVDEVGEEEELPPPMEEPLPEEDAPRPAKQKPGRPKKRGRQSTGTPVRKSARGRPRAAKAANEEKEELPESQAEESVTEPMDTPHCPSAPQGTSISVSPLRDSVQQPSPTPSAQEPVAEAEHPDIQTAPSETVAEVVQVKAEPSEPMAVSGAGNGTPAKDLLVTKPENPTSPLLKREPTDTNQFPATRAAVKEETKQRRVTAETEEPEAKRSRSASPFLTNFKMPPFDPESPIGLEFVVPKTGFFCKLCSLFYGSEEAAKKTHCSSLKHYQNMEKFVLKQKAQQAADSTEGSSKGAASV
ncbi:zinc finger protein 638 isoform X2 [Amia ocellicauda]|uniref:zinc finger protein 638 isoform X2 n=1 Tax=Amia ocellicauda TaxID=2972642 RepID=UPI00346455DD